MLERSRDDRILQPWICLASDSVRELKRTIVILHPTQATAGFYAGELVRFYGRLEKSIKRTVYDARAAPFSNRHGGRRQSPRRCCRLKLTSRTLPEPREC